MIVALAVDAAVVRTLLGLATTRLPGPANWWAPGPLRCRYTRYDIKESEERAPV